MDRNNVVSFDRFVLFIKFFKKKKKNQNNVVSLNDRLLTDFTALTENFKIISCQNEDDELTDFVN